MKRFLFLLIGASLLVGCSKSDAAKAVMTSSSAQEAAVAEEEKLEAIDVVIVVDVDPGGGTIILQNSSSGKRYELNYDGRTEFFDKYGEAIAASQVASGDIADVRLSVHSGYLKSLELSPDVFTLRNVKNYTFNENLGMLSVGSDNYRLPERLVVLMYGQVADISDICEGDILTVRGRDRQALTATVESSHGYLKLLGEESFIGGWIQAGDMIKPVTKGMLLTLPEGRCEVKVTYKGRGGIREVEIEPGRETTVDISDLKDELVLTGSVKFNIEPAGSELLINGKETEYLLPVELEYGVYRVTVKREGYLTYEQHISVGKEEGEIDIELVEDAEALKESSSSERKSSSSSDSTYQAQEPEDKSSSSASSSSSQSTDEGQDKSPSSSSDSYSQEGEYYDEETESSSSSARSGACLFIDEPDDVEVYYDGSYKGISPLGIAKESGTHVITLRKDGFVTKSYTVTLADNDEDESYSFRELVPDN